jgi:hypothetical protein
MPTVKIPLTFADVAAGDAVPTLAIYALADGKPPQKVATAADGSISLDPAKLRGLTLGIGPDADPAQVRVRADQVLDQWLRGGLVLPKERWWPFFTETICVAGDVKKCRPWYLSPAYVKARPLPTKLGVQLRPEVASGLDLSAASIRLPFRCLPLCDGVVEIHERVCCCTTFDWRDLVDRLRDLLDDLPVLVRWPDPPIPDPGPRIPGVRPGDIFGGLPGRIPGIGPRPPVFGAIPALDALRRIAPRPQLAARASLPAAPELTRTIPSERLYEDYQALLKIRPADVTAFVDKRPYLSAYLCRCSSRKVGEAPIQPNGEFDFCYRRPRRLHTPGQRCHTVFAYRVKQQFGPFWITVYDGVAGQDYFGTGEEAHLRTSHPIARPCGDGPTPPDEGDGTAFVMLEHVGGSHHFNFPAQTGLSNMANLGADSGLIDFGGAPDCPWATTLGLRLWSSKQLDGIVVYYRFKAVPVDGAGNPVGTPITLTGPVSWQRFVSVGGQIVTTPESLGADPATVGGEVGLYRMPYWTNGNDWLSGQYHQLWDTRSSQFPDGKYMLLIELFGPGGARIKPASAPAGDPGTARPFQFRRWTSQTVTANVPFADCGHVFWVNNKPVTGDIVDIRKNGNPSGDECQFISGPGGTTTSGTKISIGFRAFHTDGVTTSASPVDNNSFMAGYSISWQRGLNGPSGMVETGTADQGEAGPEPSNEMFISDLLGAFPPTHAAHTRCTFSVHLHVDAKHTNGGAFIDAYDYHETASFALEVTP